MPHEPRERQPETNPIPERITYLAMEGVRGDITRDKVARTVKRVMMAAHHAGLHPRDLRPLLGNPETYRLARQVAYRSTPAQVEEFLAKMWAETWEVHEQGGYWSATEAYELAEAYFFAKGHTLNTRERRVMVIALAISQSLQIVGKVALPVRQISDMSAMDGEPISRSEVARILKRLSDGGEWLSLVERGRGGTHHAKASLYRLIPASGRSRKKSVGPQGSVTVVPTVERTLVSQQPVSQEWERGNPRHPNLRAVPSLQPVSQQPVSQDSRTCAHGIPRAIDGAPDFHLAVAHVEQGIEYLEPCWLI